jgi:hypothetical protein
MVVMEECKAQGFWDDEARAFVPEKVIAKGVASGLLLLACCTDGFLKGWIL